MKTQLIVAIRQCQKDLEKCIYDNIEDNLIDWLTEEYYLTDHSYSKTYTLYYTYLFF